MKLHVMVGAEQAGKTCDSMLGTYRKEARIPGFRKGKVPDDLLVRKFGESLKHEAALSLVGESLK